MRCYLDADLSPRVAVIARAQGLDVVSAHELGQHDRDDGEILRLAARDGRCLVTRNRDDFILLTVQFFENEWPHAGVLIVSRSLPNSDFAGLARALVAFASQYSDAMEPYTINFLSAG
ncbi:MAG TPA: DUF5615 family PIN-like protein [Thermomicrobiales bacterium]|nr:DUF5615 family PIN-like protein [Thermomicrobiales bacterium]